MRCTPLLLLALIACSREGTKHRAEKIPAARVIQPSITSQTSAPDEASQTVLKEALQSRNYATRLTATESLACIPGSLHLLEKRLADPEEDVRAASLVALAYRKEPHARALLHSVRDDDSEDLGLRVLAVRSLSTPQTCR